MEAIMQDVKAKPDDEDDQGYTEFGAPDNVAEYIADLSFQLYEMAMKGGLPEIGDLLKATSTLARQKSASNRSG